MTDKLNSIKNLTVDDLVYNGESDTYTVIRNGYDLGVFVKVRGSFHFRDNQNKTWVCQCSDIDTGASSIEDAVAFMSY